MRSGPFLHGGRTTRALLVQVLLALVPVAGAAVWRDGGRAAALIAATCAAAWLAASAGARQVAGHESALVTGTILALTLPATAPWWLGALGGALAVAVGKQLGSGPGNNLFNPAALARAVLMGVAPALLFAPRWPVAGAVTAASPLAKEVDSVMPGLPDLVLGNHPGALAEAAPLAVVAGGLLLIALRTVDARVPLVYLAGVAALALVLPPGARLAGHAPWLAGDAIVHLFGGGTLFAAFFMLTDPVTAPFTPRGRTAFALLAAAATMLGRFYTPYPDAAALAVLLANAAVPLIDAHTLSVPGISSTRARWRVRLTCPSVRSRWFARIWERASRAALH